MRRWAATLMLALASIGATAAERHAVLFRGERLEVVDHGGLAIWQGDIVLGRTADLLESTRKADLAGAAALPFAKGTGLATAGGRWPRGASGLFEVPYVIETDSQNRVPAAIVAFNQQLGGMFRAVPRTTETDYVAFSLESEVAACFSSLGRIGGRQVIGGIPSCSTGALLHELGHAIGLYHEQTRDDHGVWVSVDIGGVDPGFANNYRGSLNQRDLGIYDYGSLMHYGAASFSKTGAPVLDSIPPGIPFGQRAGYSRGDIDALRRLYGLFDATIVVDTFPSGLAILVDGTSRVAPAELSWPPGSTHTIEVPANAQLLDGVVHTFARWSNDSAGTLATRQTITVSPGSGTITEPAAFPAVTVYTANFIRMKEIRLTASGSRTGIGGSIVADPPPFDVPGLTGAYYRERQEFTLAPVPGAGAAFGRWNGSFSFPIATTTRHAARMRGPLPFAAAPAAYDFDAHFVDYPFVTIRARSQDGEIFGINAMVARLTGSVSQRMPYATVETSLPWRAGETADVSVPETSTPFGTTIRYRFLSLGAGPAPAATITHPAVGQPSTELVATYNKQYQPFRQVNPSCAGAITLGAQPDGWVDARAAIPVTLTPAAGWVVARWRGSVAGSSGNTFTLVANDVPDVVADMNVVPIPLEVSEVSPASVAAGSPVTLEIRGQGFTSSSRVLLAGAQKTPSSIEDTRIRVPLAAADLPASGRAIVTVQNRPATGSCALNASATVEVLASQAAAAIPAHDYSDLWWNAAEPGWGLNLIQHASHVVFGVLYTYDENGKPLWLVMPGGEWTSPTGYTGSLYRVTGPAFTSPAFNPAAVNVRAVGTATLTFAGRDNGTFTFTVDGRQVVKSIARQSF